jgi:putative sigma-54 modulation protein
MIIEIHSPSLKIGQKELEGIRNKIMDLSHSIENISRAEIFLTQETFKKEGKSCKIRLDIFGDTLFVHKTGSNFNKAVSSAVRTVKRRLKEKLAQSNLPPEVITSTVKI